MSTAARSSVASTGAGVPRHEALARAEEELKRAQLWDKADKMSRTLSGGMKRRLMIARAPDNI